MNYSIVIPTYNPGDGFDLLLNSLLNQTYLPKKILIIDSDSDEDLDSKCNGIIELYKINKSEFNHGGTRQLAVDLLGESTDYVVFMTQDVRDVQPDCCYNMVNLLFKDNMIGAVCARQLPHTNANPIAQHLRYFNYPEVSHVLKSSDIKDKGFKAAFLSNSCSAYNINILKHAGGFPLDVILGEDTFVAAKMLSLGYSIAYCSKAMVRHSHNYTFMQELKRYFDIGVFHSSNTWYMDLLDCSADRQGLKYVLSEFLFCLKKQPFWIPRSFLLIFAKYLGYKLGRKYNRLPLFIIKKLSMHYRFWNTI